MFASDGSRIDLLSTYLCFADINENNQNVASPFVEQDKNKL